MLQAFLDLSGGKIHGFALQQTTGLESGTLYTLLQRMVDDGWLVARLEEIDEQAVEWHAHTYYHLTDLGQSKARAIVTDETLNLSRLMPGWLHRLMPG